MRIKQNRPTYLTKVSYGVYLIYKSPMILARGYPKFNM